MVPVGVDGLMIGLPDDWVVGEGSEVVGASPVAGRYTTTQQIKISCELVTKYQA